MQKRVTHEPVGMPSAVLDKGHQYGRTGANLESAARITWTNAARSAQRQSRRRFGTCSASPQTPWTRGIVREDACADTFDRIVNRAPGRSGPSPAGPDPGLSRLRNRSWWLLAGRCDPGPTTAATGCSWTGVKRNHVGRNLDPRVTERTGPQPAAAFSTPFVTEDLKAARFQRHLLQAA